MNKLKITWILWGFIMVGIVIALFFLGLAISKKNKPYKKMENEIVEIAKIYVESSTWYPEKGQHIKVKISELIEKKLLDEVVIDKDKCDGYVQVYNNGIIEYKTYLNCKNYTTHGYEK